MTFQSKYVPHYEAEKIIAERVDLDKARINPLGLALAESAILPEVRTGGEWRALVADEWGKLKIFRPNPYQQTFPRDDEIKLSEVRFLRTDIDRLWPNGATSAKSGGRPLKFDWEEILIEMARIAHDDGLPATQAEMVDRIQKWYAIKHPALGEPGDTETKKRVRELYKALKSET
jgi:hypothetical protein